MKQCEFCGAILPDGASFCGKCGHVPSQISQRSTHVGDLPTSHLENAAPEDYATILIPPARPGNQNTGANTPSGPLHPVTLVPIPDEDVDENEKRRRAALLGMGLPLLGELANQPTVGQIPGIAGTPQVAQVPSISGTPAAQGSVPFSPGTPAAPGWQPPLQAPVQPGNLPPPRLTPPPSPGHPGGSTGGSTGGSAGCLTIGAIIAAALLIILATVVGLGLTVLAPSLSLNGSNSVTPGSNMTLHGSSFLPNSSVTLTLDGGAPVYVLAHPAAAQLAYAETQRAASTGLVARALLVPAATNVVPVQGDGTFNITFQVNATWSPGRHTIHATESFSHRSASLAFTVLQPGASATPTPTPTDTSTPNPTATATPTATPTTAPASAPVLSCVTPGNLALGPVSEFSSQTASGRVTLCTSGSGTLTWRASWDQNTAPWLQMGQTSGSVQAPNQFQATISASAAKLAAGTYRATITFIGVESNTTQALAVTFTVQAGCLRAPTSLVFTATAGSNPTSQALPITNCGLTSDWSASAATTDQGNWLAISPSKGTLKGKSSTNITVTVTSATLAAGKYQGSITLKLGSKTVTVTVNLTVQPPQITASPNPVNPNCTSDANGNVNCTVTLTNLSNSAALSWSGSASQSNVTITPGNDTIPAGGQETVTVVFSTCATTTVTFSGPGNAAIVTWNCIIQ